MSEHEKITNKLRSCFKECLSGDILMLRMIGLHSMGAILKEEKPNWHNSEAIPFIIGLCILTFGITFDFNNFYDALKNDFMYAIEVLAAIATTVLCIAKGFVMWAYRHEIYDLLDKFKLRWYFQVSREAITSSMIGAAQNARKLRILYSTSVTSVTIAGYATRPYVTYLRYYLSNTNDSFDYSDTVFPAKYFFILDSPLPYFCCTFFENIGMYFLTLYWIAADCLFVQLMTHLSIQFSILSTDIRRLNEDKQSNFSSKRRVETLGRLKAFVKEHLDLVENVDSVQALYNPIIFAIVLVNGLNLCSCIYGLQYRLAENNWGDVQKNICHAVTILMQTFLYCSFAQRLSDETNDIRQAFYDCSWIDLSAETKTGVVIVMTRTQKEFVYSAFNLIELNMPQVTTIVTTAMRYLTLLRSMS